jgi:hypothetical protein
LAGLKKLDLGILGGYIIICMPRCASKYSETVLSYHQVVET